MLVLVFGLVPVAYCGAVWALGQTAFRYPRVKCLAATYFAIADGTPYQPPPSAQHATEAVAARCPQSSASQVVFVRGF